MQGVSRNISADEDIELRLIVGFTVDVKGQLYRMGLVREIRQTTEFPWMKGDIKCDMYEDCEDVLYYPLRVGGSLPDAAQLAVEEEVYDFLVTSYNLTAIEMKDFLVNNHGGKVVQMM